MIINQIVRKLAIILLSILFMFVQTLPGVLALSTDQKKVFDSGVYYFDVETTDECSDVALGNSLPLPNTLSPSEAQTKIAQTIIGIAKTNNLGQRGALIGLMTGLAESHLKIYANSNVPVSLSNPAAQAVGKDHDSVGVFQQRPSTGWSTFAPSGGESALSNKAAVWQLMDPAYSAQAFFGSPSGAKAPSPLSKGLQNVSGWESMAPWLAAQAVQRSAFSDGSNYRVQLALAQDLLKKNWASSPSIPLPVSLKDGGSQTSGGIQIDSCGVSAAASSGECEASAPVYGSQHGAGSQYTQAQLTAIFGEPGTYRDHRSMESRMIEVDFLGRKVKAHPKVAPCLAAVAQDIKAANIKYQIRSIGCYRFDSTNGTSNIGLRSYHTYGAACDINPDSNPWVGSGASASHDMPPQYVTIFHNHGFTWGGYWTSVKDYMHFEFNGITPP